MAANQQVTVQAKLRTPDQPGTYQLRWDLVHEGVAWFTQQGDAGLLVSPLQVTAAVEVAPAPTPTPAPQPVPVPAPAPGGALVQIQNVINQIPRHPTRRYAQRSTQDIQRLIIHHTATDPSATVARIAQYHVSQGLPGASAHFYVAANGEAYQALPVTETGAHAGQLSWDSLGISLIGNFMQVAPPQPQLEAAASVLAQLAVELGLSPGDVVGFSEIAKTASPGATWPQWKNPLLSRMQVLMATVPVPAAGKPIEHYMLLWHKGSGNWAEWDMRGALDYISKFPVTIGFSADEAKLAKYVTIVGGSGGVPAEVDDKLRAAGCKVDRLAGQTERDTRRMLKEMAAQNKRFLNLK